MISTLSRALSRFGFRAHGSLQVDSIVMMSGLVGLGLLVLGTAGQSMGTLALKTDVRTRVAVLSPNFDASACPSGWITAHAAHTGLAPKDLRAWYAHKNRTTDSATIIAALAAHAKAPRDFRYRAPLRLAELQILMCLAEQRDLAIPDHP